MRTVVRCLALVAALAALVPAAPAAASTPAQVFYVPPPEDQVYAALKAIFPGDGAGACNTNQGLEVGDPIFTYLSITPAAEGTVITYVTRRCTNPFPSKPAYPGSSSPATRAMEVQSRWLRQLAKARQLRYRFASFSGEASSREAFPEKLSMILTFTCF